jgi:hypothetical protein
MNRSESFYSPLYRSPKRLRSCSVLRRKVQRENAIVGPIEAVFPHKYLAKLRIRQKKKSLKVSASLAYSVIKQNILHMLVEDKQHHLTRSRSEAFGHNSPSKYQKAPIKLSDQLKQLLESANKELNRLNFELQLKQDSINKMRKEFEEIKFFQLHSESHSKINTLCLENLVKTIHRQENSATFKHKDKLSQQKAVTDLWLAKEKLSLALSKKYIENIFLIERTEQFNHWNLLLNMKHAIVGEQLKGSYESFLALSHPVSVELRLDNIIRNVMEFSTENNEHEKKQLEFAHSVMPSIIFLTNSSGTLYLQRKNMISDVRRIKNTVVHSIHNIGDSIEITQQQSGHLVKLSSKLDEKLKSFTEEYDRIYTKMNNFAANNAKDDMKVDKICENCGQVYTETNNFNWSCKTHSGTWGGTMYWCCGKKNKEAIGCIMKKHQTKEQVKDIEENAKKNKNKQRKCYYCHKEGHNTAQCDLDPNSPVRVRSKIEGKKRRVLSSKHISEIFRKEKKEFKTGGKKNTIEELKESVRKGEKRGRKKKSEKKEVEDRTESLQNLTQDIEQDKSELFDRFPIIMHRNASKTLFPKPFV